MSSTITRAVSLVLLGCLAAGCGGGAEPEPTASAPPASTVPAASGSGHELGSPVVPDGQDARDFRAQAELDDGRRVAAYQVAGTGLVVQVRSAGETSWSAPTTLVGSTEDPCQGVELEQAGGTVALTAGFGLYCYDGEPPQQVVAAVLGEGDDAWAVRTIDDVDDFTAVKVAEDGRRVDFEGGGGTITWRPSSGFA
ncbi:MAG: hypothetical protein NTV28_13205 [Propionibacteriales bacterium]|nr:hypothetical protein [Propionibacteriales bacterium]